MSNQVTIFRTPTWFRALLGIAFALILGGFLVVSFREGLTGATAGVGLVALFFAAGLADALTTRVELGNEALTVVTNFRKRVVPRAEIASVNWEAGGGVVLKSSDGSHIKLPDLGNSQSRSNTIRAWLKRRDD